MYTPSQILGALILRRIHLFIIGIFTWIFMHDHLPGPEGAVENRRQRFLIAPNVLANINAMKKKKKKKQQTNKQTKKTCLIVVIFA